MYEAALKVREKLGAVTSATYVKSTTLSHSLGSRKIGLTVCACDILALANCADVYNALGMFDEEKAMREKIRRVLETVEWPPEVLLIFREQQLLLPIV